jgi:TetR/AcrR family acrAB operon transcriptional repressor
LLRTKRPRPKTQPPRKPRLVAEARREEILDAAQRCFQAHGYHTTTVDQIATHAGLSKGAIYWHFKGKRELFLAIFDRYLSTFDAYRSVAEAGESAEEGIRQVVALMEVGLGEALALAELSFEFAAEASRDTDLRERMTSMFVQLRGLLAGQVERGNREGEFRCEDPQAFAATFVAALDGLMFQRLFEPNLDLKQVWDKAVDVLLRGIAA